MAFIISSGNVLSFAEFYNVEERDKRVFQANEGLEEDDVEDLLIRSTERIETLIQDSSWWADTGVSSAFDINLIIGRQNDFTDLCVYHTLYEYLYPLIADFGDEDNAEVNKIAYYKEKFDTLASELIKAGDWYDFDDDGVITDSEVSPADPLERRYR